MVQEMYILSLTKSEIYERLKMLFLTFNGDFSFFELELCNNVNSDVCCDENSNVEGNADIYSESVLSFVNSQNNNYVFLNINYDTPIQNYDDILNKNRQLLELLSSESNVANVPNITYDSLNKFNFVAESKCLFINLCINKEKIFIYKVLNKELQAITKDNSVDKEICYIPSIKELSIVLDTENFSQKLQDLSLLCSNRNLNNCLNSDLTNVSYTAYNETDSQNIESIIEPNDEKFMREAIVEALKAQELGEIPVGAVIVQNNEIVARGYNCMITTNDPTAHAEVVAIRNLGKLSANYRLLNSTLYVTLEPCIMCTGAMLHARIDKVVYGARDYKTGAIDSFTKLLALKHNHNLRHIGGVLGDECSLMLSNFFKNRRLENK